MRMMAVDYGDESKLLTVTRLSSFAIKQRSRELSDY